MPCACHWTKVPRCIARDTQLSVRARMLWVILRDFADASGVCWPSPTTIQRLLGCSRGAREKAEHELKQEGLLKTRRVRTASGQLARREYVVCDPAHAATAQKTDGGNRPSAHKSRSGGEPDYVRAQTNV